MYNHEISVLKAVPGHSHGVTFNSIKLHEACLFSDSWFIQILLEYSLVLRTSNISIKVAAIGGKADCGANVVWQVINENQE